jgi:hypothetical protein
MYGRILTTGELRAAISFAKKRGFTITETKSGNRVKFTKSVMAGGEEVMVDGIYFRHQYVGEVNVFWSDVENYENSIACADVLSSLLKDLTITAKKFHRTQLKS